MSMRSRMAVAASIAAAAVSLTPWSPALGQAAPGIRIDRETPAFELEGWAREVAQTGTIFYQCQVDRCGRGSTVSVRRQTGPSPSAAQLERLAEERARAIRDRSNGEIIGVSTGRASVTGDDVLRQGRLTQDLELAGSAAGTSPFWTNGFVASRTLTFTIVSSAQTRQWADANYDLATSAATLVVTRDAQTPRP